MVLSMDRWRGKVAVVTGASSGIGAATAKKLVEEGLIVIGLARRKEKIEELANKLTGENGKLYSFKTDLSQEEEILAAFKWIEESGLGPVHVLVNNAGALPPTTLYDGDSAKWKQIVDVNLLGVAIASREAIRIMRKHNVDGHIVNINSIAGHAPLRLPNLSMYPATKYGVTAMTETLRHELVTIKSKIRITSVSPGAVLTPMVTGDDNKNLTAAMSTTPFMQPEDIADGIIYTLSTPPHVQVHEIIIKPVGEPY